uniref:Vir like m6A methyltransferase associated n=1 Tax=Monodelphis domestica TaxID=13616 RepID=A0A5F8G3S5_MONDO
MAVDSAMELLFLDTFKHPSAEQSSHIDVVRFPCVVYINEVRVIPPGVRAHSSLPDNRAYGETSPHTFQLDFFFNNVSKPSAPVFDRLGSLDYDENTSIIFRPNSKVNTDGLVLRGWYNCLTLAIYGSVDRVISHDRDSPPPPPPPPPPPQQQPSVKRTPKHADSEKEEQFNGSPPRPQPRGPRTPPGPPPPDDDDDDEEPLPVPVVGEKEDDAPQREDYFEPISPDRTSVHQEGQYSDEGEVEEDQHEEGEDEEEDADVEEEEDEDEEDGHTVESIPEEEEDEEEEEEEGEEEGEEEEEEEEEGEGEDEEEEGEGDDGYEQISSDEDGIADLERETFKYPNFDVEYTAEDLASVPPMTYDPYDRELVSLAYFSCPYKTTFEIEVNRMKEQGPDKENSGAVEASVKLLELLELYQEDRGAKWVTALEEVPSLIVKGLSYLQFKNTQQDYIGQLVDWTMQALNLQVALRQPIALNVRQLKAGTKLVSSLAECGPQGVMGLLQAGVISGLFELLFADHVSSSLKLNAFKALDSIISMTEGMEDFLRGRQDLHEKSGYQKLLELILLDQTVRVVTAGSAILQKCHFYEILSEIKRLGDQLAERSSIPNHSESEQDTDPGLERTNPDYENEVEASLDIVHLLESSLITEGEIEKLINLLDEIFHLMETAPHTMIQPPVKSFPTIARITGPPERDDPYPVLFRYLHSHHFLELVTLLLSIPAISAHPAVLQAMRDVLKFLTQSQKGLLFFLSEHEATNLLIRALCHLLDQEEEDGLQSDGVIDDTFALWLQYSTQTLQFITELFCHFQHCTNNEETDHSDLLGTLHNLYQITFNPVGRAAVGHVFSLEKNLQSLITLMEYYSKEALGDSKSKKSVAYNYACILVLLVVQSSSDVQMLEQHAAPLLKLCKADENNTKLQELGKWLEPLKNLRFEINCIPNLIEYVKQVIEPHDISVALNTRKLWSMHLHVQAKLLQEIVRSFSGTTCLPIQHMLRRICVQLCDLASPTALLIMRTVLDLIVEDMQSNSEDKEKQYTTQTTRLLALLDALASHKACKLAILHLINGTIKGDEKYAEIFQELLALIRSTGESVIHQQCVEYVTSILQSLCDQDIALILPSSSEGSLSELEQLSNSLPNKELMASICDCLLETIASSENSYNCLLTCVRTMMFLAEHDYGFFHLKSSLRKHSNSLYRLLKRVVNTFSKDTGELTSSFLEFMRQILNSDTMGCCGDDSGLMEVDGSHPSRTLSLNAAELKQLLQSKEESPESLFLQLEKHVLEHSKDDDNLDSLQDNIVGLRQMLESAGDPLPLSDQDVEPVLSAPESLQNLFNNRTAYVLADVMDDQLKSMWFSPFQSEEIETDLDLVKVDLIELSEKCYSDFDLQAELERSFLSEPSSPGRTKTTKGFKLGKHKHETFITSSGKSEYIEPAKRAHIVPPPRGRGRGGFGQGIRPHDIFRQRKQNTSRPPSMHVDDFVAAESKEVVPQDGLPPPKRPPKVSQKISSRGGFSGNRGGRGAFHSQNRFFTPPASKGNYSRREGTRGSSWSAQSTPRGTYNESRGGQSNFSRGPLPPLRPLSSAGYRPSPRDRASRGRGGLGPSWASANSGSGGSRGKFVSGGSGRGRHVRSFTR